MTSFWLEIGTAVAYALGGLLLGYLTTLIINRYVRRLSARTRTDLDNYLLDAIAFPLRAALTLGGLELGLAQLSAIPDVWDERVAQIFYVFYWLVGFILLYRLIDGLFHWYEKEVAHKTETELDDQFLNLFRRISLLVLSVVVFITVLSRFGVEISALVTTLGIGSLAVALAAQDTVSNLFAGLTIMIDRPFKVGDRVELLEIETWGDVMEIGLRSTRIRTRDNRMVTVPNSVIGQGLIVNYSDPNTKVRVETHVGIAYGTDLEHARQVMIEAIRAEPWVMKDELIEALFLEFGDSSLNFRVRCWIEDYLETRRVIDKMNSALYIALQKAEIEIPFPQRDVYVRSMNNEQ